MELDFLSNALILAWLQIIHSLWVLKHDPTKEIMIILGVIFATPNLFTFS